MGRASKARRIRVAEEIEGIRYFFRVKGCINRCNTMSGKSLWQQCSFVCTLLGTCRTASVCPDIAKRVLLAGGLVCQGSFETH